MVGNGWDTFVFVRPLLRLEKLIPFFLTLLCEEIFWDPSEKIRQSEGLLYSRMSATAGTERAGTRTRFTMAANPAILSRAYAVGLT